MFLTPSPDGSWDGALDALEQDAADERPLDSAALDTWAVLRSAVAADLPAAEEHLGARHCELSDAATGIQLSLFPGDEVALSVPYWHEGPAAEQVVATLRAVVARVEEVTGLTAYDPQAGAPFLGAGEATAAETFDRVATTRHAWGDAGPAGS